VRTTEASIVSLTIRAARGDSAVSTVERVDCQTAVQTTAAWTPSATVPSVSASAYYRVPPGPYKSLKVLKFHTFKYKALKSP